MSHRFVAVLGAGLLMTITLGTVATPSRAGSLAGGREGQTLLRRESGRLLFQSDGEARLVSASDAALEARRQPEPTTPKARVLERRQRPNTVSVGVQGQYGGIRGNSRLADGFDHGPGYAFRFRYMVSTGVALGFSFEHQRFGSINEPIEVPGEFADSHVVATTVAIEGVFYVHRERMAMPYFIGGFGYATPDVIFAEDQSSRVNEGTFLVTGVGFERFVRPRFSIDVSLRGYALVSNSQFTSMGQAAIGIHLYPGD